MVKKFCFILFVTLISVASHAQQPDPDFTDKMAIQEGNHFKLKSAFQEKQDYSNFDLIYQRMEWQIDPNIKYIKGAVTSYFKSEKEQLTEVAFDLDSLMAVDSVKQDNRKIQFYRKGDQLWLQLRKPLKTGQTDSVKVFYQGEPEKQLKGFGAFTKSQHAGIPVLWTLSEPYGAMEWWPCKQSLVDKIDSIDVIVTSPKNYRTASNGILVSEFTSGETRTMHWKHRYPIATYLVAVAVTNYSSYSDWLDLEDGRKIEILNYVYPENLETAKTQTPKTAQMINLYNQLFGEYPFAREKYGHAQFGWGGGMEHQTMSFMYNFEFELVAHELAHQWFGDYITLGSWHDIWLNEGFATYLHGLAYEHLLPEFWYRWRKVNVERIVSQPGGSVYVKDTTNENAIFSGRLSYSKGAYLLHMLRWIMGDSDFYKGMRNYFNDPALASAFAVTPDFQKHMELTGDTTFTEYFNDWYFGEGFPIYSANYVSTENGNLKIKLSQTTSHPSVSFFEMPVPVRVYSQGRRDSTDFRLTNTINNQEFQVKVNFPVAELVIDPDYWLVSKTAKVVSALVQPSLNEISIYPNPFTEVVSVIVPAGQQLESVTLFSTTGSVLKEFTGNETTFHWPDLHDGIYFIQIKTTSGVFGKKLVKQ